MKRHFSGATFVAASVVWLSFASNVASPEAVAQDTAVQEVSGVVVNDDRQPVANAEVVLYYHRSWTGFGNEVVERVKLDRRLLPLRQNRCQRPV